MTGQSDDRPVRDSGGTPIISPRKPWTDLKVAMGERNEYTALQSFGAGW